MYESAPDMKGYKFGSPELEPSSITLEQLEELKQTVGFTAEDTNYLRIAGTILCDKAEAIVMHWRSGIIVGIPHLAQHSRSPDGQPLPEYLAASNRRFEQWILDTCFRPYDQAWLDYQTEIALRHSSAKKNQTDDVASTPFVPLRHILGFATVINESIRAYLDDGTQPIELVDSMHRAWCRSVQLQISLWSHVYSDGKSASGEW